MIDDSEFDKLMNDVSADTEEDEFTEEVGQLPTFLDLEKVTYDDGEEEGIAYNDIKFPINMEVKSKEDLDYIVGELENYLEYAEFEELDDFDAKHNLTEITVTRENNKYYAKFSTFSFLEPGWDGPNETGDDWGDTPEVKVDLRQKRRGRSRKGKAGSTPQDKWFSGFKQPGSGKIKAYQDKLNELKRKHNSYIKSYQDYKERYGAMDPETPIRSYFAYGDTAGEIVDHYSKEIEGEKARYKTQLEKLRDQIRAGTSK